MNWYDENIDVHNALKLRHCLLMIASTGMILVALGGLSLYARQFGAGIGNILLGLIILIMSNMRDKSLRRRLHEIPLKKVDEI